MCIRDRSHSVPRVPFSEQCGPVHIGIDSGSTTVKLVVVDEKSQILYTNYQMCIRDRAYQGQQDCFL